MPEIKDLPVSDNTSTLENMRDQLMRQIASQGETIFKKPAPLEARSTIENIAVKDRDDAKTPSLQAQKAMKDDLQGVIGYLLRCIKNNSDKSVRHDAAKAVGYLARIGALNAEQKILFKNTLSEAILNSPPPVSIAFAMLEALERVDPDAFWSMVMSWYGTINKSEKPE